MKLLFKQRFFSWLDSYDIYYENGQTAFTVEGKLAWGHKLEIYYANGQNAGMVREELLSLFPRFAIYVNGRYSGCIRKRFSIFKPVFTLDCNNWTVVGDFWGWNYQVNDAFDRPVMSAEKQLLKLTDTYVIDVADPANELLSLMIVLAIDAAKCSEGNS